MNVKAWILGTGIVLILGGGLYYFLKNEPPMTAPTAQEEAKAKPAMTFSGNQIVEEENGRLLWEIHAEVIEIDPDTNNVHLQKVEGTFYSASGTVLKLSGNEGAIDSQSKDITLTGNVQGTSSDGGTFAAPQAQWQEQSQKFFASGGVKVTKPDTVLTGDNLTGDMALSTVEVSGHAHIMSKGGQTP